jgi:hypothetical protein
MTEENINICFQTTSEIRDVLERIAAEKNQSVSFIVESIVDRYLKDHAAVEDIAPSRRRLERKHARLQAYIGDPRWQRKDFEQGTILDISLLGIRLSVPKGTTLEIPEKGKTSEFCIIFNLPDHHWPIQIKCLPKWTIESEQDVQLGLELVNHDVYAFKALQKYMI